MSDAVEPYEGDEPEVEEPVPGKPVIPDDIPEMSARDRDTSVWPGSEEDVAKNYTEGGVVDAEDDGEDITEEEAEARRNAGE